MNCIVATDYSVFLSSGKSTTQREEGNLHLRMGIQFGAS